MLGSRASSASLPPPSAAFRRLPRPSTGFHLLPPGLVGYASGEYFHFVMEALPKLALLLPQLHKDPSLKLAVPVSTAQLRALTASNEGGTLQSGSFAAQLLWLVLPADWFAAGRLVRSADEATRASPSWLPDGSLMAP